MTFLVDSCHHTVNGTTVCAYELALKPEPEPIIEEVSFSDPPYIFVFGLAGLNVLSFILVLLVMAIAMSRGRSRDDDDDDDDDWMKEFIGTSAEPDMDEIAGAGVTPEAESKSIPEVDEDDDDPFAINVLQRKSRRGKKKDKDPESGRRVVKRKK